LPIAVSDEAVAAAGIAERARAIGVHLKNYFAGK
jgi:hypothetical protein